MSRAAAVRLAAATRLDLRLQVRHGFLAASFVTVLAWLALLAGLTGDLRETLVPVVVFVDLALVGFFFVGGLVFTERGQRIVQALRVTPLRFGEYLAAKLTTLTCLALVLAGLLVVLTVGLDVAWLPLLAGTVAMSLVSLLVGFTTALPFGSFSSYLVPSNLPAAVLYLPLLPYAGVLDGPWVWLTPTGGALALIDAGFTDRSVAALALAVATSAGWVALLAVLARRAYERYALAAPGGR